VSSIPRQSCTSYRNFTDSTFSTIHASPRSSLQRESNRIFYLIVSNRILTPFPVDSDRRRCLLLATYLCIKSNPRICHVTITIISSIRSILQYSTEQYYVNILLVDCYCTIHFTSLLLLDSLLSLASSSLLRTLEIFLCVCRSRYNFASIIPLHSIDSTDD